MGALRTIFGPAVLAMAVTALLAYLLSGRDDEYLDEPTAPLASAPVALPPPEPATAPPPPPVTPPAVAAPAPPPAAPPAVAAAEPPAVEQAPAEPPPSEPDPQAPVAPYPVNPFVSDAATPPPLPDKLREQAMKMVSPALMIALEKGDLKQLKTLRAFFEQRKREELLPEREVKAIDLAIACLEQAPDAREKAEFMLTHGAKLQFADGLRKACGQ